jgi:predicted N-acetyltransferase YhbS
MEIRGLREGETAECVDLICLAFSEKSRRRFENQFIGDSSFEPEQARVCIVDGRIVSHVRVSDRPIRIGFAVVRMGGIGAVATHPDYRGRGYSTALLWDAVNYMEREQYDVSMLFTGLKEHYGKIGWACFPEHHFSLQPAEPPALDTPYSLRDFDEARDLEAIVRIYNTYNQARTGTMARPRRYWDDPHSRIMGVFPAWVVEREGEVVAYHRGTATHFGEVAYLPGHTDAVAPICARAMREAQQISMAAQSESSPAGSKSEQHIGGHLPKSHPALELLARWSRRPIRHEESEGMMLRVIRLVPLMQKVGPALERRLSQAGLLPRRTTICLREMGQAARIVIDGNHLHVEEGDSGDIVLEPGTRRFFKLLFGDRSFTRLRELIPGAEAVPPQDAALLDALFPQQEAVYYDCDHF